MILKDRSIWIVTRGGGRVPHYQSTLVQALKANGASHVEVVNLEGLFRSAAHDLTVRAGEWIGEAAERIAQTLRFDKLFKRGDDSPASEGESGAAETPPAEGTSGPFPTAPVDLILVDDPALLRALGQVEHAAEAAIVAFVDDFHIDTRWRREDVSLYLVPHEALRQAQVPSTKGVTAEVAGPPVGVGYLYEGNQTDARTQLGIDASRRVVLVAAGDLDRGLLDRIVFQLTLLEGDPAVWFHYGRSAGRAQVLRDAARNYGLEARIFGEVEAVEAYYASADQIIVGANYGGLLELCLARRPLIVVGKDGGATRSLFLSDQGAVVHVEDVVELSAIVDGLAADAERVKALVVRASALVDLAHNDGIARSLAALLELHRNRPVAAPEKPAEDAPSEESSAEPAVAGPAKASAFEDIGLERVAPQIADVPLAPISAAEAKSQLAALILREREAERSLTKAVRERDRWLERLDLSKSYDDIDLTRIAEQKLRVATVDVTQLNQRVEVIARSKEKLKERARRGKLSSSGASQASNPTKKTGDISNVEARFRRMEVERDLARLRRRLDDE